MSPGSSNTSFAQLTGAGVPAVIIESGRGEQIEQATVNDCVTGNLHALRSLGLIDGRSEEDPDARNVRQGECRGKSSDVQTLYVQDIVGSLYRHGFRRVLILSGHGGNSDAPGVAAAALTDRLRDLRWKLGHCGQVPRLEQVTREACGV